MNAAPFTDRLAGNPEDLEALNVWIACDLRSCRRVAQHVLRVFQY
jgi:hypothetical protein